jgi:membrane-associated phospholipid phosphatase
MTTEQRHSVTVAVLVGTLLTLFTGLGVLAHHVRYGTAFDHAVLNFMVSHRNPLLTTWASAVTNVFSPVGTGAIAIIAGVVLWRRLESPRPALVVVFTLAVAGTVSTVTKLLVGAHRPAAAVQLISETDPSFPSGHVTGTVALLGALTVVVGHHTGRVARATLFTITVLAAVAAGLTRLYLGVHWADDILGGLLLGSAAAISSQFVYRRLMPREGTSEPDESTDAANAVSAGADKP